MKFGLQGTMTRHWKRHQLPDTNYTKRCPLCPNAKFKRVWVLKQHMNTFHKKDTPLYNKVMEKYKDIDDRPSKIVKGHPGNVDSSECEMEVFDQGHKIKLEAEVQTKSKQVHKRNSKKQTVLTTNLDQYPDAESDGTDIERLLNSDFYQNTDSFQKLDGSIYIANELEDEDDDQDLLEPAVANYSPKLKRKLETIESTLDEQLPSLVAHTPAVGPRVSPRRKKVPTGRRE